jgi:hypothetical protein
MSRAFFCARPCFWEGSSEKCPLQKRADYAIIKGKEENIKDFHKRGSYEPTSRASE